MMKIESLVSQNSPTFHPYPAVNMQQLLIECCDILIKLQLSGHQYHLDEDWKLGFSDLVSFLIVSRLAVLSLKLAGR